MTDRTSGVTLLAELGRPFGFDVVATTAEETKNPQRDVPRGIIGSLVICTILYVAVTLVITGTKKYSELTWIRFLIWMAAGLLIYFAYSSRNSRLAKEESADKLTR